MFPRESIVMSKLLLARVAKVLTTPAGVTLEMLFDREFEVNRFPAESKTSAVGPSPTVA